MQPAVVANLDQSSCLARNEIFGPVLPLFQFEDLEDALTKANDTEYGLAAYAFTNNLKTEPIFALMEQKYNIPLLEAEYKLEAVAATADVSVALRVPHGSPIFLIERTSYSTGGRPVDYERLYYRGDLIRFVTRLARRSSR